jgi:c(7)-type cytochrome triheme protein
MKGDRMLTRIAAFAVAVLVLALSAAPVLAQPKIPPDFTFEKGKDSPGPVTYSHEKHAKAAEKCTACHTKVFKMKKGQTGPLTMEKMKAGEQCGACHSAKAEGATKAFAVDDKANCEKCHKK